MQQTRLLHDVLEDQPDRTSVHELGRLFGAEVARIVLACSDTTVVPKPPWRERKEAYIYHLRTADGAVLKVSLADKLHNARSIVTDLGQHEPDLVWARFSAGSDDQIGYYGALGGLFGQRLPCAQQKELEIAVQRMATSQ